MCLAPVGFFLAQLMRPSAQNEERPFGKGAMHQMHYFNYCDYNCLTRLWRVCTTRYGGILGYESTEFLPAAVTRAAQRNRYQAGGGIFVQNIATIHYARLLRSLANFIPGSLKSLH